MVRSGRTVELERCEAALEEFRRRMSATPWSGLRRLDQELRYNRWATCRWFPDWLLIRPEDVERLAQRPGCRDATAELLSMHPDGYVREASVRLLAHGASTRSLPFLLLRAVDWVAPVRERAQAAVRAQALGGIAGILCLPLLEQLAAEGGRAAGFAAEVRGRVGESATTPHVLVVGIGDHDRRVRRAAARLLVARGEVTGEPLAAVLAQDDVTTASIVGRAALAQAESLDPAVVGSIWASKIGSLRAEALHHAQASGMAEATPMSEAGLFDRSPGVRSVAQRWLADRGTDLRRRYEDALPQRLVALHGLVEVARPEERDEVAAVIAPFLADERIRAREFAVQATAALRGAASRPVLIAALDDPSPAVVRAGGRAFARQQLDPATLDELWNRAAFSDRDVVRRAAFWAFQAQSRWPRLVIACRAVTAASVPDDVRLWGERLLRRTRDTWYSSFTRPTPAQRDELDRLVPVVAKHLPPADARDLLDLYRRSREG